MTYIYGDEFDNVHGGEDYGDVIFGLGGNDPLSGGLGLDILYGGDGDDELSGGWGWSSRRIRGW